MIFIIKNNMENFGNIKDTFEKIIFESVITKDEKGKKLF